MTEGRRRGTSRSTHGSLVWRRVETRYRYIRASRSFWRWVLGGIAALVVLTGLWIVITGLVARSDADAVRSKLATVKQLVLAGNVAEAEKVAAGIPALAHRAHKLTTGPAWFVTSEIPYLGRPLQIVRGIAAATDELGGGGVPSLLDVVGTLDPAKLRVRGDTVNLAPIITAAPKLKIVAAALDQAERSLAKVPHSSWLAPVDSARSNLATTLGDVGGYIDAANRAAQVLPAMLGQDSPKRYFVGLQNEAEMRGTGGLPGAFAILVADKGVIKFTHFESDAVFTGGLVPTGLDFGTQFNDAWAVTQSTQLYVNSNVSPNFPYAAQVWAAMWQKVSGEHVDGALAMDPQVLANLLAAVGPIPTTNGSALTSANVVALTEQQEYAIFTNNSLRKQFLVEVLKAVSNKVIDGAAPATTLLHALSNSASQHRLLAWVSDPASEQVIEQTNYSGVVPTASDQTFAGLVLNNAAAGKLDYYLRRSLTYTSSGCGSTRDVTVTITLTNTAPASGLPAYVTTRLDSDKPSDVQPGDNRTLVDYYATTGAQLASVSINGKASTSAVLSEFNHPIFRLDMELPHGTTSTIVLHLIEPKTKGSPVVWEQPGVTPVDVEVDAQSC